MERANPVANMKLWEFLDNLPDLDFRNALEVAMGDALVTQGVLHERFEEVDMLDRKEDKVKAAELLKEKFPKINRITQCIMQTYRFQTKYNLIVMRWCSGFLNDFQLKEFLMKAQDNLKKCLSDGWRDTTQRSYIVLIDNIATEGEKPPKRKGQEVRFKEHFEMIFDAAKVRVMHEVEPFSIGDRLCDVKMWTLQ